MNPRDHRESRASCALASFHVWLTCLFLGVFVGNLWLEGTPTTISPWLRLYLPVALVSSVVTLAIVPGALFLALWAAVRSPRALAWSIGFTGALSLAIMYTDTIIYRLLGYHINGAVWNVVVTRGSEDAIHLGPSVWVTTVIVLIVLTLLLRFVFRASLRWSGSRERQGLGPHPVLRPRVICLAVLLPAVFVEKGVYAAADVVQDREVRAVCEPLPLYPRVRLGRILDPEHQRLPLYDVLPPGSRLAWPLAPPQVDPAGPRPNIFLLVVDSWRRDMLTPELTPNIAAFAADARRFENHLSGGNGTRYGVFSMLYGLHGSYWVPVLAERRSPVLIDTLVELGYDVRVFSSASMSFPEFDQTAWVSVPDKVVDEFESRFSSERDVALAGQVEAWLEQRAAEGDAKPFFTFVLLDSPHQPYYSPEGGPYQPAAEELDYIKLATNHDPALVERVMNRYKNSVLHADGVAGRLLDSLSSTGHVDDTVVIVTGDHGEEFQEHGKWGHTSNFSPTQIEVPFLMRGPGVQAGVESRPTSHLDLSNSLLEMLGADREQRRDYSLGASLFDPPAERVRAVAGWSDLGLLTPHGVFLLPHDPLESEIEVYDAGWHQLYDVEVRSERAAPELEAFQRECVRFLAQP